MVEPPLRAGDVESLRTALDAHDYTVDGLAAAWGPAGTAALGRGDVDGLERLTRGGPAVETLARLFLLGEPVPQRCFPSCGTSSVAES